MTPTTVTVDVDRPASVVFAYAIDPTHFHEWQNGVVTGRMDRQGMPAVGDHCVTTRRIGGAERPSTSEVVRIDPPHARSVRRLAIVTWIERTYHRRRRQRLPRQAHPDRV